MAHGPAATKLAIRSADVEHEFSDESLAFYRFVIPVRRGLSSDDAEQATAELAFPRNGGGVRLTIDQSLYLTIDL